MDSFIAKDVKNDINEALEKVGIKWNMAFNVGTIRYNDNEFSCKITGIETTKDIGFKKDNFLKAEYMNKCGKYGMKNDDFGKVFESNEKRFRVCGVKPANRKYPILAKNVTTGKIFKFTPETVINGLG